MRLSFTTSDTALSSERSLNTSLRRRNELAEESPSTAGTQTNTPCGRHTPQVAAVWHMQRATGRQRSACDAERGRRRGVIGEVATVGTPPATRWQHRLTVRVSSNPVVFSLRRFLDAPPVGECAIRPTDRRRSPSAHTHCTGASSAYPAGDFVKRDHRALARTTHGATVRDSNARAGDSVQSRTRRPRGSTRRRRPSTRNSNRMPSWTAQAPATRPPNGLAPPTVVVRT